MAKKKAGPSGAKGTGKARKPAASKSAKAGGGAGKAAAKPDPPPFLGALAALLRSRKIKVPKGLLEAPPEAYANQDESVVDQLAALPDAALTAQAEKVASWAARQAERARAAWESSPIVGEIRRRGLREPPAPSRVIGAAFSMKKPLRDWSDAELLDAAREWSRRAN